MIDPRHAILFEPVRIGPNRIGDCVSPRATADAIFDGHRIGREIDGPHPQLPLPVLAE